jgi:molybdenum cofactor biosynthesis enzyme MoaA
MVQPRLNTIGKLGVLKIDISGGEPLVYPWLRELCEAIQAAHIAQTLTTSGIGSPKNKEFIFKHFRHFARILLSIDAPTALEHDRFRGHESFDAALGLFNRLVGEAQDKVRINTVITKQFIEQQWFEQMERLTLPAAEWCLIQPHPANEKMTFRSHSVSDEEFELFIADVRHRAKRAFLTRRAHQYASYWSLQPNGELRQHTSGPHDHMAINLDSEELAAIQVKLRSIQSWVPTLR